MSLKTINAVRSRHPKRVAIVRSNVAFYEAGKLVWALRE
jgi:hypothetical protein